MAQGKFSKKLIRLKCAVCKQLNYYTTKNKKTTEKKIDIKKYCKWCKKHSLHKESKK